MHLNVSLYGQNRQLQKQLRILKRKLLSKANRQRIIESSVEDEKILRISVIDEELEELTSTPDQTLKIKVVEFNNQMKIRPIPSRRTYLYWKKCRESGLPGRRNVLSNSLL